MIKASRLGPACLVLFVVSHNERSVSQTAQVPPQPVYKCGGEVICFKTLYAPDPQYTEHARQQKWQGTVHLGFVVDEQGNTTDIRIVKGLNPELDKQAVECLSQWKFKPATKNGVPVRAQGNVSVNFRLY